MTFLPESPLWLVIVCMILLGIVILVYKIDEDYQTWQYYKDKDLLMRKQTLRENFYRLLTNLKGK